VALYDMPVFRFNFSFAHVGSPIGCAFFIGLSFFLTIKNDKVKVGRTTRERRNIFSRFVRVQLMIDYHAIHR